MMFLLALPDVSQQAGLVRAALREVDRARSLGRIAAATDRLAGLFGSVDIGNEHAVGAQVERLLDTAAIMISGHAHHGFCSAAGDGGEHGRKLFVAHGPVLRVDQQPIVAAVRQVARRRSGCELQEQAHLGRSLAQMLFKRGSSANLTHVRILLLL